jgi:hypothetical protein
LSPRIEEDSFQKQEIKEEKAEQKREKEEVKEEKKEEKKEKRGRVSAYQAAQALAAKESNDNFPAPPRTSTPITNPNPSGTSSL